MKDWHGVRRTVWQRDEGICGICHLPVDTGPWEIDHIVPRAESGSDELANLRVSHRACNRFSGGRVGGLRRGRPDTTKPVRFLLRMPTDLMQEVRVGAAAETRSLHGQIIHLLRQGTIEAGEDPDAVPPKTSA